MVIGAGLFASNPDVGGAGSIEVYGLSNGEMSEATEYLSEKTSLYAFLRLLRLLLPMRPALL